MAFVQDNLSVSKRGVIRDDFQSTPGQAKLITVITGTIYDVYVDIRRSRRRLGSGKGLSSISAISSSFPSVLPMGLQS